MHQDTRQTTSRYFPMEHGHTQDDMGAWSMVIVAASVGDSYWGTKLNEYGIN